MCCKLTCFIIGLIYFIAYCRPNCGCFRYFAYTTSYTLCAVLFTAFLCYLLSFVTTPVAELLFYIVGSRPSDHYFRSVCWFVCLFVCAEFFSAVFDPISIKLTYVICLGLVVLPRI